MEQAVGGHRQELNLSVGVKPIMHRALVGKHLVYEAVVTLIVQVRGNDKARS